MSKEEKKIIPIQYITTSEMYILYLCLRKNQPDLRPPIVTLDKFNTHCVQTLALVTNSHLNKYLAGHKLYCQRSNEKNYFFLETNNTNRVNINQYKAFNKYNLIELEKLILDCLEFAIKHKKIPNIVNFFLEDFENQMSEDNMENTPKFINISYEVNEKVDNSGNLIELSQPLIKLEKPFELINLISGSDENLKIIRYLKLTIIKFAESKNLVLSQSFLQKIDDFDNQLPNYI